jgi:hypothetical protein
MKKAMLLGLLAVSFFINSCKKEEVPEITNISTERKSLLIDFTATWCCPCGGSLPIFKEIQSRYPYKVVPLALHADNDPYYNMAMFWHWGNIYDVTGIPAYVGDNQVISWGYSQVTQQLDTSHFYEVIHSTLSTQPACGIGLKQEISGNTMTVTTKTVFFTPTTGKLSLAIYITEDGLHEDQNCSDEDVHDHVFRASLTDPEGEGMILVNGTAEKGKVFDNKFTYTIPAAYVKSNLHIIAVVYQLDPAADKPIAILNVNNI